MPQKPILQLTGIRAIAAIAVVLFHFGRDMNVLLPVSRRLNRLMSAGHLGVDVFFVLSGFILAYNYLDTIWSWHEYKRFLWLRLARIYPVHLFTLLALVPVVLREHLLHLKIESQIDTSLKAWFANIGLLQGLPLLVHNTSWNFPAWSISEEWLAYLLFPLSAVWLVRKKPATTTLWLIFASCFGCLMLFYAILPDPGNPIETGPLRILCEFTAGITLYALFMADIRLRVSPMLLAALACAVGGLFVTQLRIQMLAIPVFAFMILELAYEGSWLARLLAYRWFVYGGEASYSLYMTHAFAQLLLWKFLPSARFANTALHVRLPVLAIYLLVICSLAVLTFEFIEKPCRTWMRRTMKSRQSTALLSESRSQSQTA